MDALSQVGLRVSEVSGKRTLRLSGMFVTARSRRSQDAYDWRTFRTGPGEEFLLLPLRHILGSGTVP